MIVKAKFALTEYLTSEQGSGSYRYVSHTFIFRPEYDPNLPEDQRFNKATPSGEIRLMVDNPDVVEYWHSQISKQFYLDFTPADNAA